MLYNKNLIRDTTVLDREILAKVVELIGPLGNFIAKYPKEAVGSYECHSICRAIAIIMPMLKVVDGLYVGTEVTKQTSEEKRIAVKLHNHSWLTTPDGAIIDPYPVAALCCIPMLLVGKGEARHWGTGNYLPHPHLTAQITGPKMSKKSWKLSKILTKLKDSMKNRLPEITAS